MQKKTVKKRLMDFLIALILFYVGSTAVLYFMQSKLLYFPGGEREPVSQLTDTNPETLTVRPDYDIQLDGLYWPAKDGYPTIVFFHGNGQAYQFWVNKLLNFYREGYGVLFTDYRGYGGAAGKPSEQGIYKDARSFLKRLNEQENIDFSDMIFFGESLGTGVAIQMATEFPPKALILESAYTSTADVAKSRYWFVPVETLMRDQYRSIDKIETLTMPKFFLHGERDNIIPIRFGRVLYEAAPEPKSFQVIANAEHNNLYEHGAALHILDFLSTIHPSE